VLRIFRVSAIAAAAAACLVVTAAAPAAFKGASSSKFTIGVVYNTATDPNQQRVVSGIQQQAKAYGYAVKVVNPNSDAAQANNLIQVFVNEHVNAIVFMTFDPASLKSGIGAAVKAKIPVYGWSVYGKPAGIVGAMREIYGTPETQRMVKDLGGKGSVLAFTFHVGRPCVLAEQAMDKILAKYPAIKVQKQEVPAPSWASTAQTTTATWLQAHPANSGPLAVWGCWDGPNVGAVAALREAQRTDVKVYGAYGQADAIVLLEKKEYTATWYFDAALMGRLLSQRIHANANTAYAQIKPWYFDEPVIMVDQSNVKAFVKKYPFSVKGTA
jgi:ribose transport system substrate-binding protein